MPVRRTLLVAVLLAMLPSVRAQAEEAPAPERIGFAMLIAGNEQMRWTLDADGHGEAVLHDTPVEGGRADERIALNATREDFGWAVAQIAQYRQYAQAAPGCAITPEGVMAFRLTWLEAGAEHVASFSDNCGGVPTDFFETMRPLGQRMEGWMAKDAPRRSP